MLGVWRLQVGQYASHSGRISSATMYSTFLVPEAAMARSDAAHKGCNIAIIKTRSENLII